MNRERMLQLASQIEHPTNALVLSIRFDMDVIVSPINCHVGESCATAACAAGFACLLFGESGRQITDLYAGELLGLNGESMSLLFYNDAGFISLADNLADITPEQVAAAIRRMVEEEAR